MVKKLTCEYCEEQIEYEVTLLDGCYFCDTDCAIDYLIDYFNDNKKVCPIEEVD